MNICIEDNKSNGIPAIAMYDTELTRRVPMIIIVHDYAGTKENMLEYGYNFAKEGFFTVVYDLSMHGELCPNNKKKFDHYGIPPDDVINIFTKSTEMINCVLDIYESNSRVISNKIGLIGFSFGGSVVYNYITGNKRANIKAAVTVLSSPNLLNYINKIFAMNGKNNFIGETDTEKLMAIQPSGNMSDLKNFPLLIVNNMNDEVALIKDVRKCHEELFFNYTNQDLLKFIEYRDGNHSVKPEMVKESISWFKKFLFVQ